MPKLRSAANIEDKDVFLECRLGRKLYLDSVCVCRFDELKVNDQYYVNNVFIKTRYVICYVMKKVDHFADFCSQSISIPQTAKYNNVNKKLYFIV